MATDMSLHFDLVDETKKCVAKGDYTFTDVNDQVPSTNRSAQRFASISSHLPGLSLARSGPGLHVQATRPRGRSIQPRAALRVDASLGQAHQRRVQPAGGQGTGARDARAQLHDDAGRQVPVQKRNR